MLCRRVVGFQLWVFFLEFGEFAQQRIVFPVGNLRGGVGMIESIVPTNLDT